MSTWGGVVARTRGLAARASRPGARRAARREGLDGVARLVAARGWPLPPGPPSAAAVETAIRLGIARELRLLDRWLAPVQRRALFAVLGDEDRRTVQRIVRGIAAGATPAVRAEGALPTPDLPTRAIEELAAQPTMAAVGELLALWDHPLAAAFATAGGDGDPLRLELALDRVFAERAAGAARLTRGGRRALGELVERWIDGTNAITALLLAGLEHELVAEECFLPGGRALDAEVFAAAARHRTARGAADVLVPFLDSAVRVALRAPLPDRAALEDALLADLLAEQRRLARLHPLSAAPVASWLLGLRVEAAELRHAAWSAALDLRGEAA